MEMFFQFKMSKHVLSREGKMNNTDQMECLHANYHNNLTEISPKNEEFWNHKTFLDDITLFYL